MDTLSGALNLKNKAFGPFCNFNFNSFCVVNGKLLGAAVGGLYQVGGQADDGVPIEAHIETPVSGWGSERVKRVRFMLLGAELHGKALVEVLDRKDNVLGALEVDGTDIGSLPGVFRLTFGRNTSGRYLKFRISNVDGAFMAIDSLYAHFTARPHGTSKNS
jgi:hypothetical protein